MFEDYTKGTFEDYKKEVIEAYREMKNKGELKAGLENPSPGQLRDFCLQRYLETQSKKEDELLMEFFDPKNRYENHETRIEKFELDGFRPLISFMKEKTTSPQRKNVKLLAWLIGFESYETWRNRKKNESKESDTERTLNNEGNTLRTVENNEREEKNISEDGGNTGLGDEQQEKTDEVRGHKQASSEKDNGVTPKNSVKKIALYIVAVTVIAGGTYMLSLNRKVYMFWKEDHYQPISHLEKVDGKQIIALDEYKVAHFRKVNQPDTLTKNSLGKIFYAKMGADSIEFYTDSGFHPIYIEKRLKPVTEYIIEKYGQRKP